MRSSPSGSPVSLVFWRQEWLLALGDYPVQVKFECKKVDPRTNSQAVHISTHNSRTVIDSEESSINANRKSTMGFPTSHQPKSCITPNFSKIAFRYPNLTFSHKFPQNPLKVCHKVPLSKNLELQTCSVINYLSNGINILAGDDLIHIKFGPRGTDPQQEGCAFHVWHSNLSS